MTTHLIAASFPGLSSSFPGDGSYAAAIILLAVGVHYWWILCNRRKASEALEPGTRTLSRFRHPFRSWRWSTSPWLFVMLALATAMPRPVFLALAYPTVALLVLLERRRATGRRAHGPLDETSPE